MTVTALQSLRHDGHRYEPGQAFQWQSDQTEAEALARAGVISLPDADESARVKKDAKARDAAAQQRIAELEGQVGGLTKERDVLSDTLDKVRVVAGIDPDAPNVSELLADRLNKPAPEVEFAHGVVRDLVEIDDDAEIDAAALEKAAEALYAMVEFTSEVAVLVDGEDDDYTTILNKIKEALTSSESEASPETPATPPAAAKGAKKEDGK